MNFARVVRTSFTAGDADLRVSQYDWTMLSEDLSRYGYAMIEKLLSPEDCQQIAELYPEEGHLRSHIQMAQHGFGKASRQWKTPRRRRAALIALGVKGRLASDTAGSGLGPWHLARSKALSVGLSNKYFRSLGLPSLFGTC